MFIQSTVSNNDHIATLQTKGSWTHLRERVVKPLVNPLTPVPSGDPADSAYSHGLKTNVVGLRWGCKSNAEMTTHFTVMLLLLCTWRQR